MRAIFAANKGEIAGVILEPVVGNSGFIPPTQEFLEGLREVTKQVGSGEEGGERVGGRRAGRASLAGGPVTAPPRPDARPPRPPPRCLLQEGALLCFDEVMTGFRIAKGCAQEYFGIKPDLTTMGKVIGGGLPVGAYGGRRDIMQMVAPAGPMYQAGTLSGNPLAMVAGIKTLEILARPGAYEHLDRVTKRLVAGLLEAARETGHAMCGSSISGMFGFFFCEGPVTCFEDAKAAGERWAGGASVKTMSLR